MSAAESLDDEILRRARRQTEREQRRAKLRVVGQETAQDGLVQIGDAIDPWEHDARRYRLGIDNIDRSMHPRRAADFMVVGALSGAGKTSIMEQSAVANARDGHKVLVVSLEMTIADLQNKMIGRQIGCDVHAFERHRSAKTDAYKDALESLRALPLKFFRPPAGQDVSIQEIFKIALRWEADMIALDYAGKIGGWEPGQRALKIVQYASAQTKETGIFLMLLAQLKQDMLLQKNRRPTLADFEDTKALVKEATTVAMIHRPFNGKPKLDTVAEIIVAKNRKFAPAFCGHVFWNSPNTTFFTMTQEEEMRATCCAPKKAAKKTPSIAPETGISRDEEDALLNEAHTLFT
jgi:replicative DNA helicase